MNDFTKKELMALEHALHQQLTEYCPNKIETSPLLNKIQSMIDGYCEHKNKAKANESSAKYTCMKCGELLENE